MTLTVNFRAEAEEELTAAIAWYDGRSPGLGAEFLRSFEAALASVQRNPLQYQIVHKHVRRAPLRRFPYSLMYTVSDQELLVLACFHASRDPAHWVERFR